MTMFSVRCPRGQLHWPGVVGLLWSLSGAAGADDRSPEASEQDFFAELPVVLSSTRLKQPPQNAPVAVTVIDRETIRNSGAQDIPSVLRLVPGFQMGRVTGSRTTVTHHGFSDRFQRGMQVLVDGRSVYDPGFGGVFWADLPVALEDIERIEVMRGPASSLYGANAFAATVNIITAHSQDARGTGAKVSAGDNRYRRVLARHGDSDGDLDYRLSAWYRADDGIDSRYDRHQTGLASLRGDYRMDQGDLLLFQAGLSAGPRQDGFPEDPQQPQRTIDNSQHFAQVKWTRVPSPGEELSVQLYYNFLEVDDEFQTPPLSSLFGVDAALIPVLLGRVDQPLTMGFDIRTRRIDLELQHLLHPAPELRLVWGLGARYDSADSRHLLETTEPYERPSARAFFNAEWQPMPRLVVNAGTMLEQYSGLDPAWSPRLSASFELAPRHTLRLSGGLGTRMPTLFEAHAGTRLSYLDGSVMDVFYGSTDRVEPERIRSIELAYLGSVPTLGLSLDARLFRNKVSDWIQQAFDPNYPDPLSTHPLEVVRDLAGGAYINGNWGDYEIEGFELGVDLRPSERLRLRLAWSQAESDGWHVSRVTPRNTRTRGNYAPLNTFSVLASYRFPAQIQASLGYYQVDAFDWLGEGDLVRPFHEWDLRLARTFKVGGEDLLAALVFQNIDGPHQDFQRENFYDTRAILELGLNVR